MFTLRRIQGAGADWVVPSFGVAFGVACDVWGAMAEGDVAVDGTEVTPSGLRPPQGPSSTPLAQLPSTGLHQARASFLLVQDMRLC